MTIFTAFKSGAKQSLKYWRISIILYVGLLVSALLGALPWRNLLSSQVSQSLMIGDLVDGFNYTFINDFIQNYGAGVSPVLNMSLLSVVVFLVIYLFLSAGALGTIFKQPERFDRQLFWGSAGQYFWRLLRLTLFFLILHGVLLAFFGWIYWKVTKGLSPQALEQEGIITACLRWLIPLYLFAVSFLLIWQDYAKIQLVKVNRFWIWKAVRAGAKSAFGGLHLTYPVYILFVATQAVFWWIFHRLDLLVERTDDSTILMALLFFQLALLIRLFWRIANWSAIAKIIAAD